jgi:hypothetical protein
MDRCQHEFAFLDDRFRFCPHCRCLYFLRQSGMLMRVNRFTDEIAALHFVYTLRTMLREELLEAAFDAAIRIGRGG